MELATSRQMGVPNSYLKDIGSFFSSFLRELPHPEQFAVHWMPPIEISESKDTVFLRAELPGMDAKNVEVSMSGDLVTIKGEKKLEDQEGEEHIYYSERYLGSFQRSVRLPVKATVDNVEATFRKGVLKVSLRKVEGAEKRIIQVKDQ